MSVMAIVALLGLNGCSGDDDETTGGSAESVLVGETLYGYASCANSYEKIIYTAETITSSEYSDTDELEDEEVSDANYATAFSNCTFTEDSKSVTGVCDGETEIRWKTLADAKENATACVSG